MAGDYIPAGARCLVIDEDITHPFALGDIVSRDGTDEHQVIGINAAGDLIEVRCLIAPASAWCKVGDTDWNIPRRYEFLRSTDGTT